MTATDRRVRALTGTLVVLLVAGATYQDLPLHRVVGTIASSPLTLVLPILLAVEVVEARGGGLRADAMDRWVAAWLAVATVVGLGCVLLEAGRGVYAYLGESYLAKQGKVTLYYAALWMAYRAFRRLFAALSERTLLLGFAVVGVLQAIVLAVEAARMPTALGFLHGGEFPYNRVRLLTPEASTGGPVVVVLVTAILALARRVGGWQGGLGTVVALVLGVAYTLLGESKGYLLIVGVAAAASFALSPGSSRWRLFTVVLGIPAALAVGVWLAQRTLGALDETITETATVTTRATLMLAVLQAVVRHPLGVGFGVYEAVIARALPESTRLFGDLLPEATMFVELDLFAVSSYGLFPKTGLTEVLLFTGVPGLVLLAAAWHWVWRQTRRDLALRTALVFMTVGLATYLSIVNKFEVPMLIALVGRLAAPDDRLPSRPEDPPTPR